MRAAWVSVAGVAAWLALAGGSALAAEGLPGASIYHLDGSWTDAEGRALPLSSLRGQVLVVTMAYTSCGSACPLLFADLQRLERSLPPEVRERVRFVVFSLDPERDGPERLRAFREARGLDPARWLFLVAPEERVREMAAVLGVRYRRDPRGEISHESIVSVVDRDGVIRHRHSSLGQDPSELAAAVVEVVSSAAGGSSGR
jgi:protein SCO1/2